ncbi:hypothetical protein [Mycobacterium sp. 48b]|uniref:hypothetical protein n=1 Tax=Mycobacterium sp. 48b TaxID=3400426 RepID=UPI003AAA980F
MERKPTINVPSATLVFVIVITASVLVSIAALSLGLPGPGVMAGIVALSTLGVALGLSNQQERRHSGR